MKYSTLALTIHAKCNAKCSFCCFECSPNDTRKIEEERLFSLIEEAKSSEWVKTIAISGGEPMLNPKLVFKLIERSNKYDKRVTLITNGFWATSEEKTFELLKKLKDTGLNMLSLSYDRFHAEYIHVENIKRILRNCTKLQMSPSIGVSITKNETAEKIIKDLGDEVILAQLVIYPCLPVGGAEKTINDDEFIRLIHIDNVGVCPHQGMMAEMFDGNTYPCCSQSVIDTFLSVGTNDDNINDVYKNIKNNGILYIMRNEGFNWFIEQYENATNTKLKEYWISPCELCSFLFKKGNEKIYMKNIGKKMTEIQNVRKS